MKASEVSPWIERMINNNSIKADEPILIIQANLLVYPQYDLQKLTDDFIVDDDTATWVFKEAFLNLTTNDRGVFEVRQHWINIVQNHLESLKEDLKKEKR